MAERVDQRWPPKRRKSSAFGDRPQLAQRIRTRMRHPDAAALFRFGCCVRIR